MNKEQIAEKLQTNHARFIRQLQQLNETDFCYAPEGKWSAGQQLDHIVKAVAPVNLAFGFPNFLLKWQFGSANRPSRTYDQLIEKYNRKLQEGGRASGRFMPAVIAANDRAKLVARLNTLVNQLVRKTKSQSEESLDKYILPHPLLGKLTLREMLYFTAYHVEHHRQLVEKGLESR